MIVSSLGFFARNILFLFYYTILVYVIKVLKQKNSGQENNNDYQPTI